MRISKLKYVLMGGGGLVLVSFYFLLNPPGRAPGGSGVESTRPGAGGIEAGFLEKLERLEAAEGIEALRAALDELRTYLMLQDREAAVALILQWLESGRDLELEMRFKTAPGGRLAGWPSLRVFLLDLLYYLDPEAAREASLAALESAGSPDEWAVSLRNLGKLGRDEDRAVMSEKTGELVRRQAWLEAPTAGFLEAFDAIVFLGETGVVPHLGGMVDQPPHPAVAFASLLVINRLVEQSPVETLEPILRDPGLLQAHPEARAELFARLDVRDPQSAALLKDYLASPDRRPEELDQFAETFPHGGHFLSHNLLTGNRTPSGADIRAQDRAALIQVRQWKKDPALKSARPYLERLEARLQPFVN